MDFLRLTQLTSDRESLEKQRERLSLLLEEARAMAQEMQVDPQDLSDPLAPCIRRDHRPFKVGVTALVRAQHSFKKETPHLIDPETDDPADMETVRVKRLPLPLTRPRQIADLPSLPAFMRKPDPGPKGLVRGVAAHKALSLLHYGELRPHHGNTQELQLAIRSQLQGFLAKRLFTQEEYAVLDAVSLAAFFVSIWGRDALQAQTVKREWGFVLRLPEEDGLLVQGVIDLCYIKDGQWELVDYKTDNVHTAEELWPLYEAQTALYRRALVDITNLPVRGITLYSLVLGAGSTRTV